MKVTREMVAKRSGVCKQTVSCYLNNSRNVSKELSEKIENAIAELNYVPNLLAKGLSTKKTNTLAVICGEISNPNYTETIAGIESAANRLDYSVMIFDTHNNIDRIINQIIARRIDGVIILDFKDRIGATNFARLDENGTHIVLTHSAGDISNRYMQLEPNYRSGIEETLLTLQSLGHKNVEMLSCFPDDYVLDKRLPFFLEFHEKIFGKKAAFIAPERPVKASLENGRLLARRFLEEKHNATAVLTTNDLMAIGAIKEFNSCGMGQNISVIGFDNVLYAEYLTPSLSSIGYNKSEYGDRLFRMFLSKANGAESKVEYVDTRLFRRNSLSDI